MVNNCFRVNVIRKYVYEDDVLMIQGCYLEGDPTDSVLKVMLDNREMPFELTLEDGYFVEQKYKPESDKITTEAYLKVKLDGQPYSKLKVLNQEKDETQTALEIDADEIQKIQKEPNYSIDERLIQAEGRVIKGWVVCREQYSVTVMDEKGQEVKGTLESYDRVDIGRAFPEVTEFAQKPGFIYTIPAVKSDKVVVCIKADGYEIKTEMNLKKDFLDVRQQSKVRKAINYSKQYGKKALIKKVIKKAKNKYFTPPQDIYTQWMNANQITKEELKKQSQTKFGKNVKFSIVIPLYNTPEKYLKELIDSIEQQTYSNWEICFADGSSNGNVSKFMEKYKTDKIRYEKLDKNDGISGNTNAALRMATGDYIVLADHDDLLAPNALFEFAQVIEHNSDAEVIYSDEDKIDMSGKKRFEPHFKPDFNIDLLCSVNYICHLFSVKKTVVDKIGEFRAEYDGAQDHDFIFRCVEEAAGVYHVPKILYHWRSHINSTAENPESKLYAFEAGKKAIAEHYRRLGMEAEVQNGPAYGLYRTTIKVEGEPMVSVVIPNKDHSEDLDLCLQSILSKTTYPNYEIVIVENNSVEDETFAYYKKIEAEHSNIHVVYWEHEFNYSSINNFGVEYTKGEYLLFLNNDTEVINGDWMDEMVGYCQREDVGIVGARLYYSDDTIQHAGVVVGFGGIAGHTFIGQSRFDYGYFARAMLTQDYSAVTAACMMTKKTLFKQVGGFTEELRVAFNDIDFCMKIRALDKLVVYNSAVELYHYESKSRGLEDTPEKIKRFNGEIEIFRKRWPEILKNGDPYYNPNLSLDRSDFGLKV